MLTIVLKTKIGYTFCRKRYDRFFEFLKEESVQEE